jgi:hypothetical protein
MLLRETLVTRLAAPTSARPPECEVPWAVLGSLRGAADHALVLTLDQRDSLKEEGRSIQVLPAWEWLD